MFKGKIKFFALLIVAFITLFFIHKLLLIVFDVNIEKFIYSLEKVYLFFSTFSLLIISICIKVKEKNIDIVGNIFLLLTSIKFIVSFIFVRPVLNAVQYNSQEKWNFFFLFIMFLIIETILTIILLNSKNK
jgi:hypothetical protein